jgi:CBS domain-containing protein
MSRHVVTIDAKDSVHDALQMMAENKVAALPVIDRQGRCIGMLSTSDLVDVTRDLEMGLDVLEHTDELLWGHVIEKIGDGVGHQPVTDLMSENVVSTSPKSRISEAASTLLRERIHRLPVTDENGRLLGIISATDILAAFVDGAYAKKPKLD